MAMDSKYRLSDAHTHCRWDQSIPPKVTVGPGEVVKLETDYSMCRCRGPVGKGVEYAIIARKAP